LTALGAGMILGVGGPKRLGVTLVATGAITFYPSAVLGVVLVVAGSAQLVS
jgi:hypothetical protein